MAIYLVFKIYFLAIGPGIGAAFAGTTEAKLFLLEIAGGIIVPIFILGSKNMAVITIGHLLVIGGVLLNRFNVSISGLYGFQSATGGSYFPSVIEFLITLALVAVGIFVFKLAAKYLTLFPEAETEH